MGLTSLPEEIVEHIVSMCDDASRETLRLTCRQLQRTVDNTSPQAVRLNMSVFMISVQLLIWAVEGGLPLTASTFVVASKSAPLKVLKELKNRGCPHDSRVCYHLAQRVDTEAIRWARNNGFGWNYLVCATASDNVLLWLSRIDCACRGTYHPRRNKKRSQRCLQ